MNYKSFVIGGAGFIGSNLVQRLSSLGHDVTVVDDLSSGRVSFLSPYIKFIHCDITRSDKLLTLGLENADFVFHLAAQFANDLSTRIPMSDAFTGTIGTINLLQILKDSKRLKKLIYASSSCVYGNGANPTMHENDKLRPVETPYAIQKYVGELYTEFYNNYFDCPSVSVRIFNTYGPHEVSSENRNVTSKFIEAALKDAPLYITGNGEERRDYTYVFDTVDLLVKCAYSSREFNGRVFNAGTGETTRTIDLARKILDISGSKSEIIYKPKRDWDHVNFRCSDITAAKQDLGYAPKVDLNAGLTKTINWYRDFLCIGA